METATVEKPAREAATGSATLADLLPAAVSKHGAKRAVIYKGDDGQWASKTYAEVGEIVRKLSLGLMELGIEKGDKVAILSNTRPEWTYFDFAALSAGATVVPIYQTNSPEECQYVLENSDAVAVVVEDDEQLEKIRRIRDRCPKLEHVIRMTGRSGDAISLAELSERGAARSAEDWERALHAVVTPDDICTFIYTSGTTGPPKGCVISHGNYRSMLDMVHEVSVLGSEEITYLFLPLAHSFALLIQLGTFDLGATLAYWERDPLKILPNLAEVRPTYFPSVPRIFEKIYTSATATVEKEGGLKKTIFEWAIGVGKKVRRLEREGKRPGPLLAAQHRIADRQVLSKIRGLFGGRLTLAVTGAAPINPEILEFFDAAGVLVLEGWGMTETSTAATIATPEDFKMGTVGRPFPGCEIKIADGRRDPRQGPEHLPGLLQERRGDARDPRRRLAAHGRHRRVRRRRLPEDHRPQEGHHHHRGREEHHPGQPRSRDQAAPARLPVRGDRRSPAVPGRAGHARSRRGRDVGARPRPADRSGRGGGAPGRARVDPGARRRDQQEVRQGRAGEEDRDPPRRPLPGGRRADAHAQGQAQCGRREVCAARSRGCTPVVLSFVVRC